MLQSTNEASIIQGTMQGANPSPHTEGLQKNKPNEDLPEQVRSPTQNSDRCHPKHLTGAIHGFQKQRSSNTFKDQDPTTSHFAPMLVPFVPTRQDISKLDIKFSKTNLSRSHPHFNLLPGIPQGPDSL